MNNNRKTYNFFQKASAVFMILALVWLTVSLPFVIACQQELAKMEKSALGPEVPGAEEETGNPLGNTTEEKTPGNTTVSEEYLHEHHDNHYVVTIVSRYPKCANADTYHAYHGELLVPPPNVS